MAVPAGEVVRELLGIGNQIARAAAEYFKGVRTGVAVSVGCGGLAGGGILAVLSVAGACLRAAGGDGPVTVAGSWAVTALRAVRPIVCPIGRWSVRTGSVALVSVQLPFVTLY